MTDVPDHDTPLESADLAAPPPTWSTLDQPAPTATVSEPPRQEPGRFRTAVTTLAYAFLVVAAWGALQLWGLGKVPFYTKGEPREALGG